MPMSGFFRPLSMAAAVGVLCACGDGGPLAGPQKAAQDEYDRRIEWDGITSETCALLSPAEVSGILGPGGVDSRMMAPGSGRCQWLSPAGYIRLDVSDPQRFSTPNLLPGAAAEHQREVLAGVGVEAYHEQVLGEDRIVAITEEHSIIVSSSETGRMVDILRLVLPRLPAVLAD